jgi:iron(II)-dependent oxidoreductase
LKSNLVQSVKTDLSQCRQSTLNIFSKLESSDYYRQIHPDFSPVGWHLGHIAFTEAYWILEYLGGFPPLFPEYKCLFAADGLPKKERQNLPKPEFIQDYLHLVREKVLTYLTTAPIDQQERLWRWLIQHESQHGETIAFILHLSGNYPSPNLSPLNSPPIPTMVKIPPGEFQLGSQRIEAQDNERPVVKVYLDIYWLDRYPVTCEEYQKFREAGGYHNPQYWSKEGWNWLQSQSITQPLYWDENNLGKYHPVCGVSYYEAEAYANFIGKRLPTEREWEKAASWEDNQKKKLNYPWGETPPKSNNCNYNLNIGGTSPVNAYPQGQSPVGCYDLLGNVWEWTSSDFQGYPGFQSYPYPGYSQVYFDYKHKVLRGGSWATRPWSLRNSFRNWYYPEVRQIIAGFRCAK